MNHLPGAATNIHVGPAANKDKGKLRRNAILVLGMHRSGTSVLTHVLSLLGWTCPATLIASDENNPTGYWESLAVTRLNDDLLEAAGSSWDDWLPINPKLLDVRFARDFVDKAGAVLADEFGESPRIILKDPRICRLAKLWLRVLDLHGFEVAVVVPLRDPREVARSLLTRDEIDLGTGMLLWLRHVLDAEAASRGRCRVFVTYNQLLSDWGKVADDIAAGTGVVWPRRSPRSEMEIESFIAPEMRHHGADALGLRSTASISPWVVETFEILSRWADKGENADDYPRLDAIVDALTAAGPAFARALVAARDLRLSQAEQKSSIETLEQERDEARAQAAGLVGQLEHNGSERTRLTDRIDGLFSELEQAKAQEQALIAELDSSRADGEQLRGHSAAQAADHAAQAQALNEALAELRHALATEQSKLRQREEELHQLSQEAAARRAFESERADAQQRELARSEARGRELESKLAFALADHKQRFEELAALTQILRGQAREFTDAREHLAVATQARDEAEAALADHKQRFEELAALTQILREQAREFTEARGHLAVATQARDESESALRNEIATSEDMLEWLQRLDVAHANMPGWWHLLPRRVAERKRASRLRRFAIFDADAYAARNPDVANSDLSPLQHYLRHGLAEGRER